MDNNAIEDICKVLNDIVFVFEVLNYKNNSYVNALVEGLKLDIAEIENKHT